MNCSKCKREVEVLYTKASNFKIGDYYSGEPICYDCLDDIYENAIYQAELSDQKISLPEPLSTDNDG